MKKKIKSRIASIVMVIAVLAGTFSFTDTNYAVEMGDAQTVTREVLNCLLETHSHSTSCYGADGKPSCGYADYALHTHDGRCYDGAGTLICQMSEVREHVHGDSCYTSETVLVCGEKETVPDETKKKNVHTHSKACYQTNQILVCEKKEQEGHQHKKKCYENQLICQLPESEGHVHGKSCYTVTKSTELTCDLEECEGHTHEEVCYDGSGTLLCEIPESTGHIHEKNCYTTTKERNLTCDLEEQEGHTHTEDCYERVLICELPEQKGHSHEEDCYIEETELTCGLEEVQTEAPVIHTHSDACRETKRTLVCSKAEIMYHVHNASCRDGNNRLNCGKLQTLEHQHTEACFQKVEVVSAGATETEMKSETELVPETQSEDKGEQQTEAVGENEPEQQTEAVNESETEQQPADVSESETKQQTESVSENESEPQPEIVSESESESQPDVMSESKSEQQPAAVSENESESEIVSESETEPQSEPASESESEPQSERASESETEQQTEAVSEGETEQQTEAVSESENESQSEAMSESEPESQSEAMSESEPEPQSEAMSESEPESQSKAMSESEPESQPETMSESEAESQPEAMSESEPESQSETMSESEPESQSETMSETEFESQTEPESESEFETEEVSEAAKAAKAVRKASASYASYDAPDGSGGVAFSLNMTRTKTAGVNYQKVYSNPTNAQVIALCTKVYKHWYYGTDYTKNCILWCASSYSSDWANTAVSTYGVSSGDAWNVLRQAVQYAIWYYTDQFTLPSDTTGKLAKQIMNQAWSNSGSAPTGVIGSWYTSDDGSAPNLISFTWNPSVYWGRREAFVSDGQTIKNCYTLQQNGSDEKQIAFCYDPSSTNPTKDGVPYTYVGIVTDYRIRKILYNGYPHNKAHLLEKSGLSVDKFWYATQRALWYYIGQEDYSGEVYELLAGKVSSIVINGETLTLVEPPDSFIVKMYTAGNYYQRLLVSFDNETEEDESEKRLTLTKKVSGSFADTNRAFSFRIRLTDKENVPLTGSYKVTSVADAGSQAAVPELDELILDQNGEAIVLLKHGQSITIEGLPAGYGYQVEELIVDDTDRRYTADIQAPEEAVIQTSGRAVSQTLTEAEHTVLQYTNIMQEIVRTGVRTDTAPIVWTAILAIAGAMCCLLNRRRLSFFRTGERR